MFRNVFFILALTIIAYDVWGQLPDEHSLYPKGIKDNKVIHPTKESHVDSIVNFESLSGENRVFSNISEPTYLIFPSADATVFFLG